MKRVVLLVLLASSCLDFERRVADCFDAAAKVGKRFLVFVLMRLMEKIRVLLSAKLLPQYALHQNCPAAEEVRYFPERCSIGEVLA